MDDASHPMLWYILFYNGLKITGTLITKIKKVTMKMNTRYILHFISLFTV